MKFYCEKCNTLLYEDPFLTIKSYDAELKEIFNDDGELDLNVSANYLLYVCSKCDFYKKIDINELIYLMKKHILESVGVTRATLIRQRLDKRIVKEENGVSYCGLCPGVIDETGYCYNDVIKQCEFWRLKKGA